MSKITDLHQEINKTTAARRGNGGSPFLQHPEKPGEFAENYIRILDTPGIWGLPFNDSEAIMERARARQKEFEHEIWEIVQGAQLRCDIASLNSPDPAWIPVLVDAIDTCLSAKKAGDPAPQFRFLFGQTPLYPRKPPPNYRSLKAALVDLVVARRSAWRVKPEFWLGRFYRFKEGLMSQAYRLITESLAGELDRDPKDSSKQMTWNHAKIIAADGISALVGGHNLNMDLFRSYPPVHDVSVVVHGPAAEGSQQFLNGMWSAGASAITTEALLADAQAFKVVKQTPDDPLARNKPWIEKQRRNLVKLHQTPGTNTRLRRKGASLATADSSSAEFKQPVFRQAASAPKSRSLTGYHKATGVLGIGKYFDGKAYQDTSERMKELLIKGAKKSIYLSQMDLISAWKPRFRDHHVCRWLMDALLAQSQLEVRVVVSPLDGGAGAEGDQYSFGAGAVGTFRIMEYFMIHDEKGKLREDWQVRAGALERLKIAPLYFTADGTKGLQEGFNYIWDNLSAEGWTDTLRRRPLSPRNPPKNDRISNTFESLKRAAGHPQLIRPWLSNKVPSAPGNHAKIMIVDEELYVVGSDNLYPGFLSEFNFVVEGEAAVKDMLDGYWNKLWQYSSPFVIPSSVSRVTEYVSGVRGGQGKGAVPRGRTGTRGPSPTSPTSP